MYQAAVDLTWVWFAFGCLAVAAIVLAIMLGNQLHDLKWRFGVHKDSDRHQYDGIQKQIEILETKHRSDIKELEKYLNSRLDIQATTLENNNRYLTNDIQKEISEVNRTINSLDVAIAAHEELNEGQYRAVIDMVADQIRRTDILIKILHLKGNKEIRQDIETLWDVHEAYEEGAVDNAILFTTGRRRDNQED